MNVRIQFDVAEDQWEEMKTLMDRCGMETRKELFNNAWALLDWAVRERAQGNVIASINDRTDKIKELEMPIFRRISSTANLVKAN
ncbi:MULTISPECIES: hypothetical protein [Burkholderia]|uniref:hypothetical protein n=1 Tax=Burkholderia TaxID=32008 RepID=UPI0012D35D22|nr:hypothetical protein [Burkholderia glumae]